MEKIMFKYIPLFELVILIFMVMIRSVMLRRHGIKAIVFGVTDKTDFIIIPFVLFFFYALLSGIFNWSFPAVLTNLFWKNVIINICAIVICTAALIWFGVTLKTFGRSFRVGIDEKTEEKLITNGTFSVSRNPIYLAFILFFTGIFLSFPNIISSVFLALLILTVHRQILREENFLISHYGSEFEEYCSKVRRYI
jgi:protein-S-isoprenylcysteine O-methyltransferase Ste14